MNKTGKIAFGVMILIIIILSLIIVFRPSPPVQQTFNEKPYLDSIATLNKDIGKLHSYNDSLTSAYNVLEGSKQQIIIRYKPKYAFIKGASIPELDSIIRFHW